MSEPDIQLFREKLGYFIGDREIEIVSEVSRAGAVSMLDQDFTTVFPKLTSLLSRSRVTALKLDGEPYLLYGWTSQGRTEYCERDTLYGWLSYAPTPDAISPLLHPDHQLLLRSFGGIIEHFYSDDAWDFPSRDVYWLASFNYALCQRECMRDSDPTNRDGWGCIS
jgi:hypothetical protein